LAQFTGNVGGSAFPHGNPSIPIWTSEDELDVILNFSRIFHHGATWESSTSSIYAERSRSSLFGAELAAVSGKRVARRTHEETDSSGSRVLSRIDENEFSATIMRAAKDTPRPSFSGAAAKEAKEEERRRKGRGREREGGIFPVIPVTGLRNSLSFLRIVF